jgi:hypothetical protein
MKTEAGSPKNVIPAKAGIQPFLLVAVQDFLSFGFRRNDVGDGMTTPYGITARGAVTPGFRLSPE